MLTKESQSKVFVPFFTSCEYSNSLEIKKYIYYCPKIQSFARFDA